MIVTCPQCSTKFSIEDDLMRPDGRKVRCSRCSHSWFQVFEEEESVESESMAEAEELIESEENIDSDVTDGEESEDDVVMIDMPDEIGDEEDAQEEGGDGEESFAEAMEEASGEDVISEEETVETDADDLYAEPLPPEEETGDAATPVSERKFALMGYGAAAGVFVLIILVALAAKGMIVDRWPASYALYDMVGMAPTLPVQQVEILDLQAVFDEKAKRIHVSGEILNLSDEEMPLALMRVDQLDEHDELLRYDVSSPPAEMIKGGGSKAFELALESAPEAKKLVVGFSLGQKPKAKVDGHEEDGHVEEDHEEAPSSHEEAKPAKPESSHAPEDHHMSHGH